MKRITTERAGVIGPVTEVEELADRLRLDTVEWPLSVIGTYLIGDWVGPLPAPVELPPVVPEEVTMRQAREELIDRDLIDTVDAVVNAIPDAKARRIAQNAWTHSQTVQRRFGLVAQLQQVLGWNDALVDDMFVKASRRV